MIPEADKHRRFMATTVLHVLQLRPQVCRRYTPGHWGVTGEGGRPLGCGRAPTSDGGDRAMYCSVTWRWAWPFPEGGHVAKLPGHGRCLNYGPRVRALARDVSGTGTVPGAGAGLLLTTRDPPPPTPPWTPPTPHLFKDWANFSSRPLANPQLSLACSVPIGLDPLRPKIFFGAFRLTTFKPTEGRNVQWREANRRRQRQINQHHGLVPTPPPPISTLTPLDPPPQRSPVLVCP